MSSDDPKCKCDPCHHQLASSLDPLTHQAIVNEANDVVNTYFPATHPTSKSRRLIALVEGVVPGLRSTAGSSPAEYTKQAIDWDNLLRDIVWVNLASLAAVVPNQAAYYKFRDQAKALIEKLNEQPPISPDLLLEALNRLITVHDLLLILCLITSFPRLRRSLASRVPVAAKSYPVLSGNLATSSVEYLKHFDKKDIFLYRQICMLHIKLEQTSNAEDRCKLEKEIYEKENLIRGEVEKSNKFGDVYSEIRSLLDGLGSDWIAVGEKLSEILSLLQKDTEKQLDTTDYAKIQTDLQDSISKFTVIKDTQCIGFGFCGIGC